MHDLPQNLFFWLSLVWPSLLVGQEMPLAVGEVRYEAVVAERQFDAVIEAVKQSTVSAQTAGRIIEIRFDVDDYVPEEEIIVRIRDTEQKARLEEAQARYREAQQEYRRVKEAYEKEALPKANLDRATADLEAAQSRLEEAREQLQHTVVKAPFSGIVMKRHVEVGETARPGQALMTGLSLDQLRAVATIPQSVINSVRKYSQARVLVPDQGSREIAVAQITVFPYADPVSHAFRVRAQLPERVEELFPGMFVKLAVVTGEEQRLLAPQSAVVYRSEVAAVYVIDADDRIAFRQVRLGRSWPEQDAIEALAGLEPGERVALDPIQAGIRLKQQRQGELIGDE